jgi:F420H(2)-dependent quinone reductase
VIALDGWQVKMQMFFSKHVTRPGPHRFLYRMTGGFIGSRLPSVNPDVLLLTARGRRSGKRYTTPLIYFRIDQRPVVAATNNGEDRHPSWYLNLRSNPDTVIQIGRQRQAVRARTAEGEERQRIWERITEIHPLFAAYQRRTEREIPVIVLEPLHEACYGANGTLAITP